MSAPAAAIEGAPLAGRAVLVAGAHGGYGRAVALACARAGAMPVLLGRKARKLERVPQAVMDDALGRLMALLEG